MTAGPGVSPPMKKKPRRASQVSSAMRGAVAAAWSQVN